MSKFCCPNDGFHLIEILIALAMIGIASQWMIANYQHFIVEEYRREAQHGLVSLASALENYAFENNGFHGASLRKLKVPHYLSRHQYELRIEHVRKNGYLISARPLSKQAVKDAACGVLFLSSTGEKYVSGSATTCWTT